MTWLFLSLITAFTSATADALIKKYLGGLSALEMSTIRLVYTLPWLLLCLFFIPVPTLDRTFFMAICCGLPLELLALTCYIKAIKISPLSLTLPFLSFTPVFMILTGKIILHETLTMSGIAGIALIVTGSYCLNLEHMPRGVLEPFRAIGREPGSLLMILVAFIYSITSSIGKLGVLHSSPAFFGLTYFSLLCLVMLALVIVIPGAHIARIVSRPYPCLIIGVVFAAMILSHMVAISMVDAAYMIAVKRLSLVFGVLYGAFLFREGHVPGRLFGAAIMVCGVLVIGLFG